MLPNRDDPSFPEALRNARLAKKLNMKELAELIGIHGAMIGRYEDPNHSWHSQPSQKTWEKLNDALFGNVEIAVTKNNKDINNASLSPQSEKLLKNASFEEIVNELKRRGAVSIQINFSK
jgi:transcriptional regulator with XRE-family HTH domain